MPLKKLLTVLFLAANAYAHAQTLHIENNLVSLSFHLNEKGVPQYAVKYDNREVIKTSSLGFIMAETGPFDSDFEMTGADTTSSDTTWKPVWGEVREIRNRYKQLAVHLRHKGDNRLLNIVFRVFEEGVGFRYEFPLQDNMKYFIVAEEKTAFSLAGNHKTFWIPGDYDSNEYEYSTTRISDIDNSDIVAKSTAIAVRTVPDPQSVQTPLMMKSDDGLYINIHEASLRNYPAMQLHADRETYKMTSSLVPDAYGNKAYLHAPCHTPWRTIIVSSNAADLLSSKMILNLNDPSGLTSTSWITPMKFLGVWWEMQTGMGGWNYADKADVFDQKGQLIPNGRHRANTANVKRYIDFASKNGIKGVLVEGWNVGWEDWFGNWKEDVFDFVTPYPDFDVQAIHEYARKKGVQMIMHNETSGSATNYERHLDTAFRFMNKYGYHAVKTGYVGKIIPRGEHHDGQWMVKHLERVAEKGLQYKVMIDMHESMRPTGLQRTYPNWMANEAGRGNEYNAFSTGNKPEHETILPFTRLMGGPMDYTPGIFKLRGYAADTTRQVHTTLAKQLALYVTLFSPFQMAADLPQNYEAKPDAFQFIKDVPVDWDDTRIIVAEPGDYVAIARKGKGTENWFIGAITDENKRTIEADLSFLNPGRKYTATVYADGEHANWKTNPEDYLITKIVVDNKSRLRLNLAEGGGAAVSIVPLMSSRK